MTDGELGAVLLAVLLSPWIIGTIVLSARNWGVIT